ncbi:tetratricopeptide repeat protein [Candidatus Odyssella thessalonicensis]|uniref:tetratricopeptide repeat protein n=1 Tax=Candidatus Odyssella thessalonicensis TaxID=84647 RepID=UPI000225BE96|nr:SEL1-like repeat protein [Candidatus Odyssella thessalonicensis]
MQEILIKLLLASSIVLACVVDKVSVNDIPLSSEGLRTRTTQLHAPDILLHNNIDIRREEANSCEGLMEQAASPEEKSSCEKGAENTDHSYLGFSFDELMVQAEAGYPEAQYAIGECYLEGKGVEKNETLAFEWFMKAATQGLARANNDSTTRKP